MRHLHLILLLAFFHIRTNAQLASEKYRYGVSVGDKNCYKLLDGDSLFIQDSDGDSTMGGRLYFKHRKSLKEISGYFNIWNWLEMDSINYFMIGSGGRGSGNPEYIIVINKKSCDTVYTTFGWPLFEDTVKNVIVFDDCEKHTGCFTVYNLNTNTSKLLKEPKNNPCFADSDCWKVIKLTDSELIITFTDNAGTARTVTYNLK